MQNILGAVALARNPLLAPVSGLTGWRTYRQWTYYLNTCSFSLKVLCDFWLLIAISTSIGWNDANAYLVMVFGRLCLPSPLAIVLAVEQEVCTHNGVRRCYGLPLHIIPFVANLFVRWMVDLEGNIAQCTTGPQLEVSALSQSQWPCDS